MRGAPGLVLLAVLLAGTAACQTRQALLDRGRDGAMQTALSRGRFDLACPQATGVVLSDDFIAGGLERMEYTIAIEGCGKRTTILAICQRGTGACFAANPEHGWRRQ